MSEPTPYSSPETAARVCRHLAEMAHDGLVSIGYIQISEDTRISKTQVKRAVNRLLGEGALEVVRRGTSNKYPTTYRIPEAGASS